MLTKLRYRWYYPKCFRLQLPREYAVYLWLFSPFHARSWRPWGRVRKPVGVLQAGYSLGPLEINLTYPHWSRLAKQRRTR